MIIILVVVLILIWLLIGLSTGAYIEYNNTSMAGWPLAGRIALILAGPITAIAAMIYFVGWFLGQGLMAAAKPALEFIKG